MAFALCNLGSRTLGRAARLALLVRKTSVTHVMTPVRAMAMHNLPPLSSKAPLRSAFGASPCVYLVPPQLNFRTSCFEAPARVIANTAVINTFIHGAPLHCVCELSLRWARSQQRQQNRARNRAPCLQSPYQLRHATELRGTRVMSELCTFHRHQKRAG